MSIHTFVYPPSPPSSLPAGSATAANQTLEIAQLTGIHSDTTAINGKTPTTGQKTMANSSPVVIASDQSAVPASQSGTWNLNNISGTISLPTGAASAANQATEIGSLLIIETNSNQIKTDTTAIRTNTDGIHTDTTAIAGSAASIDGNVGTIAGNSLPPGQATMASSSPVVIASNQSPITVTGTVTASNPSVSATGAAVPASATMVAGSDGTNLRAIKVSTTGVVSTDGSAVTQPVSAASLPLPTGASTEATLSTLNGKVPSNLTVTSTRLLVDGSGVTQPISAASLPLPSGAATAAKQPALGIAGTASADVITVQGIASMTALKVDGSAVTQPVSLASTPSESGRSKANAPVRNDYTSISVTTAAYVQLVASTTSTTNLVEVFDSSGEVLVLAVGAAASEVDQFYILPGGNGQIPLAIPASSRVSVKAISATASVGQLVINFYT